MSRLREVAVAADQLLNAILGGYCCETLSSRCWRLRAYKPYMHFRPVIDALFFWQIDHCKASYEAQVARRNMPADYQFPHQPPSGGFSLKEDMPVETTTAAGAALLKIFGVPVLAGAIATSLGFLFMWPKTRREAFVRFSVTITMSIVLGPVAVVMARAWWPTLFDSAKHIARLYGASEELGFLFIAAPLMVMGGLPAWWVMGAMVRWLDKRREKDIAELAVDAAAIVKEVRGAL